VVVPTVWGKRHELLVGIRVGREGYLFPVKGCLP
jgi:hypothetical protein